MGGVAKGLADTVMSVFSPPKAKEAPPVPTPPLPPQLDSSAAAAAAAKASAARAELQGGGKQSTVFAGDLGDNDRNKKRVLGF